MNVRRQWRNAELIILTGTASVNTSSMCVSIRELVLNKPTPTKIRCISAVGVDAAVSRMLIPSDRTRPP